MTKAKYKTWSQWRGYSQVRVTTGGWNDPKTQTDTYYLRGMDGDRKTTSGGTKSVTVSDGEGGTHTDHDALAGFELKTVHFDGPSGVVHDKTVNTPWRVQTASRTRSWGTTTANAVNVGTSRTWTAMDGGTWRQTRTDTTYKGTSPGVGRTGTVNDLGDVDTASDDRCTRTSYADNTGDNIVELPSRVETVAVACTVAPDRATQVISDQRTFYDGGGLGAAPSHGDPTKTDEIASHDGATATYVTQSQTGYDAYGRPTTVTDAVGNATTTAYTDTSGLTTKTVVTSPRTDPDNAASAHVTTTELDPAWGQPTVELDAAGLRTDLAYDALGRLTGVWQPNRRKAAGQKPNLEYDYRITDGEIVAVTTKTLKTGDTQRTSYELFDGWLRPRQTQAEGPGGGRVITDTFYDARGNTTRTYAPYYNTGAPAPTLLGVDQNMVESQTAYTHDGLNRVTLERFVVGNGTDTNEKWRTTTAYGGNYTDVTPPQGGTATREITDARGRLIERRQYKTGTPSGDYNATTFAYTPAGKLAMLTDPAGNTWRHEYDLRGRETKTIDPDKGTSTATFDDLDREVSSTDARGQKLFTRYDVLGRKTETRKDSADGPLLTSWVYDTVRKGQPTSSTRHIGDQQYTTKITQYDPLDRPTRRTFTIPAAEGALAKTYTFGNTFNLDGTLAGTSYASGGDLVTESAVITYDDMGRPIRLHSNLSTYVAGAEYTYTGKLTKQTLDTGGKKAWYTYGWEAGTQRLKTSAVDREGLAGNDRDTTYTYDSAGNIRSIIDDSKTGVDAQCFTYDHLRRLADAWTEGDTDCSTIPGSSAIGGPAPYWQTYTYDTAGNRETETLHGIGGDPDTTRDYTTPSGGNKLTGVSQTGGDGTRTDSFGYDEAGNMTTRTVGDTTQTLQWDAEGNLAKITEGANTTSFIYTADGDRLLRKDPTGTTLYLPGTELRLNNGASTAQATRYYTFGDQTIAMRTGSGVQFLAPDHQGTSQLAIDATTQTIVQRRYTPFGTLRGVDEHTTWPDEKGFVGGTNDPGTGLTHLGAREYDPTTGRFISVDPIFNTDYSQGWNGYSYANNTPVTMSDPTGLDGPLTGNTNCYYSGRGCTSSTQDAIDQWIKNLNPSYRNKNRNKNRNKSAGRGHGDISDLLFGPLGRTPRLKNQMTSQVNSSPPAKKCGWTCNLKRKIATNPVTTHIKNNWRTYVKYGVLAGGTILAGMCVAATAGVCAGAGGIVIATGIGAGSNILGNWIGDKEGENTKGDYLKYGLEGGGLALAGGGLTKWYMRGGMFTRRYFLDNFFFQTERVMPVRNPVIGHLGFGTKSWPH